MSAPRFLREASRLHLAEQLYREFVGVMVRANRGGIPLGALPDAVDVALNAATAFFEHERTAALCLEVQAEELREGEASEARMAASLMKQMRPVLNKQSDKSEKAADRRATRLVNDLNRPEFPDVGGAN